MKISDLARLWRTIQYLKASQIIGRVKFKLLRPRPNLSSPPPARSPEGIWISVARRPQSLIGPARFSVLGVQCDIDSEGWDAAHLPKLLRYNLHYFDDLNAVNAQVRSDDHVALIQRWIVENPPGAGSGWEPYPLSLRIVNWIKWSQESGNVLSPDALASLAVQVRYLSRQLEWHLLGNHLFINAKAMIFAGQFFEGPEAEGWSQIGFSILSSQIPEQILADGGQFELSPMYHALAIEDVLDLVNVTRRFGGISRPASVLPVKDWVALLPKMISWLQIMSHPDGHIALFNDAAFGIAPDNEELLSYAERLGILIPRPPIEGVYRLPDSGYLRLAKNDVVAIIDVAAVGPEYLPGHAHADTLSFELSIRDQRIVVNGGTSVYGANAERQRQRGTLAHSTLCLDGHNSSEVWGGFRVGRRATVSDITVQESSDAFCIGASHDGYAHLPGGPMHRREWKLDEEQFVIVDHLEGQGEHEVEINFHFAPDIEIVEQADGSIDLQNAAGEKIATVTTSHPAGQQTLPSTWHPQFGLSLDTKCLNVSLHGLTPLTVQTSFEWNDS